MKRIITILVSMVLTTNLIFGQVNNLGPNVNSQLNEIRPILSGDGNKLFFTKEIGKKEDKQEIWFSKKDSSGNWAQSERLPNIVNRNRFNSVYWASENGETILIRGAWDDNWKEIKRGFSISKFVNNEWTEPMAVEIEDYDILSRGIYTGASMTNDQKVLLLYFTTETNGVLNDLWVSIFNDSTKIYGKPKKLNISQEDFDEISPYIANDGKTLYFSSDKDGGYGSQDIWVSKRLDNTWEMWSEPINLGEPFNTKGWDTYFSIGEQDTVGFYATNFNKTKLNKVGGIDIVSSVLPQNMRPEKKLFTKKSVKSDADNTGLQSITHETTEELIRDTIYITIVKKDSSVERINVPCNPMDTMSLQQLERELTRGRIMFDYGSSTLRSDAFRKLDVLIAILNKNPKMKIEVGGHSDSKGSSAGNLKQSTERAESAKGYLIAKGISPDRLKVKGYGQRKPVATNDTDEGRQLNRRVDIFVIEE